MEKKRKIKLLHTFAIKGIEKRRREMERELY
jgi:hypothetical protein